MKKLFKILIFLAALYPATAEAQDSTIVHGTITLGSPSFTPKANEFVYLLSVIDTLGTLISTAIIKDTTDVNGVFSFTVKRKATIAIKMPVAGFNNRGGLVFTITDVDSFNVSLAAPASPFIRADNIFLIADGSNLSEIDSLNFSGEFATTKPSTGRGNVDLSTANKATHTVVNTTADNISVIDDGTVLGDTDSLNVSSDLVMTLSGNKAEIGIAVPRLATMDGVDMRSKNIAFLKIGIFVGDADTLNLSDEFTFTIPTTSRGELDLSVANKAALLTVRNTFIYNVMDIAGMVNDSSAHVDTLLQTFIDNLDTTNNRNGYTLFFPGRADGRAYYKLARGLIFQSNNVHVTGDGQDRTTLMLSNEFLHLTPDFKATPNAIHGFPIDGTTQRSIVYLATVPEFKRKRWDSDGRCVNFNDNGKVSQQLFTNVGGTVDKDSLTFWRNNKLSNIHITTDTLLMRSDDSLTVAQDSSAYTFFSGAIPDTVHGFAHRIQITHQDTNSAYDLNISFIQHRWPTTIKIIGPNALDPVPADSIQLVAYGEYWIRSGITIGAGDVIQFNYSFFPDCQGVKALGIFDFQVDNIKLDWFMGFGVEARNSFNWRVENSRLHELAISNGTNAINGGFSGEYTILGVLTDGFTQKFENFEKLGSIVVTNNEFINIANISVDLANAAEFTHRIVEYPDDFEFNSNFVVSNNRGYNSGGYGLEAGSGGTMTVTGNILEDTGIGIHAWGGNATNEFYKTELSLTNTPPLFQVLSEITIANNIIIRPTKGIVFVAQNGSITGNIIIDVGFQTLDRYKGDAYGALWANGSDPLFLTQLELMAATNQLNKGIEVGNINEYEGTYAPHTVNHVVISGNVITGSKNARERAIGNQLINPVLDVSRVALIDFRSGGHNLVNKISNNILANGDFGILLTGTSNMDISGNSFFNAGDVADITIQRNSVRYGGGTNQTELDAFFSQAATDSSFEVVTPKDIKIIDNDFFRGPFFYQTLVYSGLPADLEADINDRTKYSISRTFIEEKSNHWLNFQVLDTVGSTNNTIDNISIIGNTFTVRGTSNEWLSLFGSTKGHSGNPRQWIKDWLFKDNNFEGDNLFLLGDTSATGKMFEESTVTGTEKEQIFFFQNTTEDNHVVSLRRKFSTNAAAVSGGLPFGAEFDSLGVVRTVY